MSKLPEHALGLEVGGKRKCKPRSKSLYSTSADAKLNLFSLYSTLALEKKKKKKKLRQLLQSKLGWRERTITRKLQEVCPKTAVPLRIKLMSTGQNPNASGKVRMDEEWYLPASHRP